MPHDALLDAIRDLVDRLGFELADLQRTGTRDRPILKVRIDSPDSAPGSGVSAEDCRLVSRALERMLEGTAGVGSRYVPDGLERTFAFADVRDAVLDVDWKTIGEDRRQPE